MFLLVYVMSNNFKNLLHRGAYTSNSIKPKIVHLKWFPMTILPNLVNQLICLWLFSTVIHENKSIYYNVKCKALMDVVGDWCWQLCTFHWRFYFEHLIFLTSTSIGVLFIQTRKLKVNVTVMIFCVLILFKRL